MLVICIVKCEFPSSDTLPVASPGPPIALSTNLTYAATLNQNLRIAGGSPLGLVADIWTGAVGPQRAHAVQVAEAGKTLSGIKSSEHPWTAAEIAGRILAPGASNSDVPLPDPDLLEKFSEKPMRTVP